MAKLTYWVAQCVSDNVCFSLVDKTKRGCQLQLERAGETNPGREFLPVAKRTITYFDAFDLMLQLTAEGGYRGYSNS